MKKLTNQILMYAMILIMAAGCSKGSNDDAKSLLRTVPADASAVAILDVARLVKSVDGKTDGKTIELPSKLEQAISESKALTDEKKKLVSDICSGETGVSVSSIIIFSAAREYVTGLLNDPDKFIAYMQNIGGGEPLPVVEEDGAKIVGKAVVIGNQFWTSDKRNPDVEQLKYYQSLTEKQSFASQDAASLLTEGENTLTYVADIRKAMTMVDDAKYVRIATSMMIEDLAYVAGNANLKDKDFNATTRVLNSEMKPAKMLLPTEKIDASLVKSLNTNGDAFIAVGLPKELTRKISDAVSSAMGPSLQNISQPLEQIDGTVAVCTDLGGRGVDARIQTTGKDFSGLSNMLHLIPGIEVTRDGDVIALKYGNPSSTSTLTSAQAADKMKGAWMGFVGADLPVKGMNIVTLLVPDGKSIRLDINVEGGSDALLTAILK